MGALLVIQWVCQQQPANALLNDNYSHLGSWVGALLAFFAISKSIDCLPTRADRRSWECVALGVFLLALGDAVWAFLVVVQQMPNPFPSPADLCYIAGYLCLFAGILLQPRPRVPGLIPGRIIVLEMLVALLALGSMLWFLVIGPAVTAHREMSVLAQALSIGYPLLDLSLLICYLALIYRGCQRAFRPAQYVLAGAALLLVIADTLFALAEYRGAYQAGAWIEILWPCAYLLFGTAALVQADAYYRGVPAEGRQVIPPSRWRMLVPYLLVLSSALATLAVFLRGENSIEENGLLLGTIVVFFIVIIRQWLTFQENRQLYIELKTAYEEMVDLARTDPITGLPNHRSFMEQLTAEVARATRYRTPLALIFLDIDFFKTLNDTHGHQFADGVLHAVGQVLTQHVRTSDLAARYGGDEYVLLLPQTTLEQAQLLAERLRRAIAALVLTSERGDAVRLTASIGLSAFPWPAESLEGLITSADAAMYQSKRRGRNHVSLTADAEALVLPFTT